jgi:hypothetical protein
LILTHLVWLRSENKSKKQVNQIKKCGLGRIFYGNLNPSYFFFLLADLALLALLLATVADLAAAPFFSLLAWVLVLAMDAVLTRLKGAATSANAARAETIDLGNNIVDSFNQLRRLATAPSDINILRKDIA